MIYSTLTPAEYVALVVDLISDAEGHLTDATDIGDGKATIGYGYTFNRSNNVALWQAAGITLTSAEEAALLAIDNATASQRTALALQFSRSISKTEAKALLEQTYSIYEGPATSLNMPLSSERAAFVSIAYNRGVTNLESRMQGFYDAIRANDRAEAWFQMRYMSWGTATTFEAGLRSRRLIESSVFGLYDMDGPLTTEDAMAVYAMFSRNRTDILALEALWGENPDGTPGTRNLVAEVNNDPRWGSLSAPTLVEALETARNALVNWVNVTQLPVESISLLASEWNSASVYFDPTATLLDASGDNGKANGVENNIVVGSETSEELRGGDGEDVLVANNASTSDDSVLHGGEGDDILIGGSGWQSLWGDGGNDKIFAGADDDTLEGGDGNDELYGGDGLDILKGGDGNDIFVPGPESTSLAAYSIHDSYNHTGNGNDIGYSRNGERDYFYINEGGVDDLYFDALDTAFIIGSASARIHYRGIIIDTALVAAQWPTSVPPEGPDYFYSAMKVYETPDGALEFWIAGSQQVQVGPSSNYPVGTVRVNYNGPGGGTEYASYLLPVTNVVVATGEVVPLHSGEAAEGYTGGVLSGSSGADSLVGGSGSQIIEGLAGNDVLDGEADRDFLWGGDGNDAIAGGTGDDRLYGEAGVDSLDGGADNDLLWGGEGDDLLAAGAGDDTLWGENGNDALSGNDGIDNLYGGAGNDGLNGGGGADTLVGNENDDTLAGGDGDDYLDGGSGNDELHGGSGTDYMEGGSGNDVYVLALGDGTESIYENNVEPADIDVIRFGAGISSTDVVISIDGLHRTFSISGTNDAITVFNWYSSVEALRIERIEFTNGVVWDTEYLSQTSHYGSEGDDSIIGGLDNDLMYGLSGNDILDGGEGADTLDGGQGDDELIGAEGDDILRGGAGNDSLSGGMGADTFEFWAGDGHDTISDQDSSGGIDRLKLWGAVTPADVAIYQRNNNLVFEIITSGESVTVINGQWDVNSRLERIEFGNGVVWDATEQSFAIVGDASDNIETGTALDDIATTFAGFDTIETGAGNDYLDGGADDDIMTGGQGNDIYVVDSEFDTLTELSSQGTDEIRSSLTWTLSSNFENLTLLGEANIDATGNSVANVINGNSGDNLIDGKAGADTLAGGNGNDTYVVDNVGDAVTEGASAGLDLVRSSVSFMLGSNVENLTLTGSGAINATGNELDNVLTGNSGNNVLTGGAGNDTYVVAQAGDSVVENAAEGIDLVQSSVTYTLQSNVEHLTLTGSSALNGTGNELDNVLTGNTGVNILTGADGNDTLNGGSGADTLIGGLGDDLYIVDNTSEVITEAVGEGTDAVNSTATYTLAANLENLALLGTNNINGTGNASANIITGNSGANVLNGLAGADTLSGGAGNDTYVIDDVLDTVTENADEGTDLVQSAITYTLGANVENVTLTGSAAINASGNDLDNVLTGNTGTNTLSGGLGNDTYVVNGTADIVVENASEGVDLVQSSVTYTLSAHVENITLTGGSASSATGNSLDNLLTGNGAVNTLTGGQGNDTLNGGVGVDILVGGAGDDLYIVDDTNETITEAAGEGTDSVESSVTYTLAAQVEQLTLTGTAAINATGNALDNVLIGNSGTNTLSGGTGADTMSGGLGNDTYVVDSVGDVVTEGVSAGTDTVQSSINYTAGANIENVTLTGSTAIDATGNELNNTLRANTGNNVLTGGLGNDIYVVNSTSGDTVVENAGEGTDTVQSSVTYTLASNVENLTLTGSGVINATGNELDNVLTGNTGVNNLTGAGGNDTLDGGTGGDIMAGGIGDDTYVVDVAGDTVNENVGEGTDTVQASLTYTAAANVENVVLTGTTAINATGNVLSNTLTGNSAANTLNGGAGVDTLIGGADNDTYVVDDGSDVVVENAAEGTDTVQSTVSYVLSANVERLTLTGAAAVDATGNELDNLITGNSAINTLAGGLGNDTYVVGSGDLIVENSGEGTDLVQSSITFSLASNVENLTLSGSAAIDGTGNEIDNVLTGNTGVNVLSGGDGNDTLIGGTGADTLIGGAGNDTFVVEIAGDTVSENAAEGTDLVQSSVTYTLSANVENLTLTGSTAINATGNDLDNVLIGNTGVNTLTGGQGNDTLNGGTGADVMIGGLGDDTYTVDNAGDTVTENAAEGIDHVYSSLVYTLGATLENLTLTGSSAINGTGNALDNVLAGNTGTNTLTGGLGNDTYIVNNTSDVAAENVGEGTDAVFSTVTFTLGANVENLALTGTGAINATGNELDNVLTGNTGNNTLNGGIGADTMSGDAGNDIYVVDAAGDVVIEGESAGTDTVQSVVTFTLTANVENLTLTGSAVVDGTGNGLDNVLTGNSGINTLTGGGGNDTLNGGSGNDTMIGGVGDDTYVVAQSGDVVTELDGEGTDLVQSSATHTLSSFVENLTLTGSSNVNAIGNALNNLLFGNTGNNTLTGHAGNDTLDGGSGTDTMVGGDGDDTYYSDVSGEVITEAANQGLDQVISSATQTLAANVEMLFLTGAAQINGNGNSSSNLLRGNDVRNIFTGGGGIDILEGAGGNDSLSNTGGGLFNGGIGNDSMSGGAGHDLYMGGTGNDTVTTGTGRDIIVFNLGDGADTVSSSTTQDNTLSIGGGATYADLLFERTGNNLILRVGATDQITLTNYYTSMSNHSLDTLQIIIEGTSDYDANSSNAMNNKKVESFDFDALVADFDAARAVNPMLTSWSLTNSLLARHLGGSDTEAFGGDLAYQYGRFGSLADISYIPALGVLAASTFGQSAQALQSSGVLQDSSPRLS